MPSGAPCQPGALRFHLTHLSTEGLGPRHGEVRRAHQMLNAALSLMEHLLLCCTLHCVSKKICNFVFINFPGTAETLLG